MTPKSPLTEIRIPLRWLGLGITLVIIGCGVAAYLIFHT